MRYLRSLLPLVLTLCCCSCASIFGSTKYLVHIDSNPSNAHLSILNNKGDEIYKGTTPADVTLKSSAGYFTKASYEVHCTLDGFQEGIYLVTAKINPWYFGNLIFGGALGMLVIDPLTGAMWQITHDNVFVQLDANGVKQ